jgi:DUF4097 and DUF4098 domain-containing protein YvlB
MRNNAFKLSLLVVFLVFIALPVLSQEKVSKTFPTKKRVELSTASGDCIIKKGTAGEITVDVEIKVQPAEAFTPLMEERSDRIKLSEDWSGNASGSVLWTVTVPPETEIEVESASGDISVSGLTKEFEISSASGDVTIEMCKGDFEISTASGFIEMEKVEGDFDVSVASGDISVSDIQGVIEFSSASGDIDIKVAKGTFDLSCASGDIEADKVEIKESSDFKAASGDIMVKLSSSSQHDMSLSSASGNITLDYNGNPLNGRFEFEASRHGGHIKAPVAFDEEESFTRNGRDYIKKIITRSADKPLISLESASGTLILK